MDLKVIPEQVMPPDNDPERTKRLMAAWRQYDPTTRLSYWFPLVERAGFPVPRTETVGLTDAAIAAVFGIFDGDEQTDASRAALAQLHGAVAYAASKIVVAPSPVFMRTDFTSSKHDWARSCYLDDRAEILQHVVALAEFSECCGMPGLPWDTIVVRELLQTAPLFLAFAGDMPITEEVRIFVRGKHVDHVQPYWPAEAFEDEALRAKRGHLAMMPADERKLKLTMATTLPSSVDLAVLEDLSSRVGSLLSGYWSIDWLKTSDRGWVLTDMANGDLSFRYGG